MIKEPSYSTMDIDNLDCYYEDCVISRARCLRGDDQGPRQVQGSDPHQALLEVAGHTPERRVVPVAEKEPRVNCLIGEDLAGPLGAIGSFLGAG
jgi:hypothetical protein